MHMRVLTERRTHGLADEMAGPAENDSTEASATGAPQPPPARIAFFGNFGTQNLGNEYTLKSIHAARTGPECVADALMK